MSAAVDPQPVEPQEDRRSEAARAITNYWLTHATEATEKQELFLQGLAETGTVIHAAEFAGINRQTAYQWRELFPELRKRWDETLENVTDKVERSLYNQAVSEKNVVATIFYLKANRAKYRDRVQVDVTQLQRQVEEKVRNLKQLPTSSASTKAIINAALGLHRQPAPAPIPATPSVDTDRE